MEEHLLSLFLKISNLSSNYFITSTPNNAKILTLTPDYQVNWTWSQITNELLAIWLKLFCFKLTSKKTSVKFTYSHRHTYDHKAGKALLPFCLNILHILQSVKNNKHTYEKILSPAFNIHLLSHSLLQGMWTLRISILCYFN